jgi:hypothetical protein
MPLQKNINFTSAEFSFFATHSESTVHRFLARHPRDLGILSAHLNLHDVHLALYDPEEGSMAGSRLQEDSIVILIPPQLISVATQHRQTDSGCCQLASIKLLDL